MDYGSGEERKKSGYGKRPLWQWLVLYAIIGGVVYGLVYFFFIANKGGYSNSSANPYNYSQQPPTPAQQLTNPVPALPVPALGTTEPGTSGANNIYTTRTDPTKGAYLADFSGMTLYTYDKDTAGVSNCYAGCVTAWPPYTSGATAQSTLPSNITVITRTGGTSQFAWMNKPLYYYATDQKPGDITGDGVGGVWHLVKP